MAYAAANGYVVPTHDLDFGAILTVTRGKSQVLSKSEIGMSPYTGSVVAALRFLASGLERGALITIETHRTRVRLLPFRSIS